MTIDSENLPDFTEFDDEEETTEVSELYEKLKKKTAESRKSLADASECADEIADSVKRNPGRARERLTPMPFKRPEGS